MTNILTQYNVICLHLIFLIFIKKINLQTKRVADQKCCIPIYIYITVVYQKVCTEFEAPPPVVVDTPAVVVGDDCCKYETLTHIRFPHMTKVLIYPHMPSQ